MIRLFLAVAGAAFAQGPASTVQIIAPSIRVMPGESMQLRAVVRDASGVERPNDTIAWSVDAPAVGTIDASRGMLSARGLGFVRITAAAGNARNSQLVQVLPKRISIEPANARLVVSERQQFRAVVYDANDQPIPNVNFTWQTLSGNGGQTNAASINAQGMLSSVAVGSIQVRAIYAYGNTGVPGFERQVQAVGYASIEPPKTYELKRLAGTGPLRAGMSLRPRIVPILGNQRGQIVFNANLDGLGNGVLMLDGNEAKMLAVAGMPGPLPQTSITDFNELSLNNRGEVLARMSAAFSNNFLYKLTKDEADVVFIDNTPLPGTEFLTGHFINRNSLSDSGDYIMRANYRVANAGPTFSGLFRVRTRGFPDEVVSNSQPLDDLPAGFTLDNDFGIAGNGLTYFTATASGQRSLFARAFAEPRKLLSTGGPLLGSTVRSFYGNGFFMNDGGDLAVAVLLNNNEIHLLRYAGTNIGATPRSARLRSFSALYAVSPDFGVLFLGDGGRGYGVYLWKDGDPTPVFLQNHADYLVRGKRVVQLDYAALTGAGDVTILARSDDYAMELIGLKTGEPAVSFLQAGFTVNTPAPISIAGILQGARTGPPHLLLGGFASSIWEASESGLKPTLLLGERYAGVQLFTGANNTNGRKAPNGDIYTTQTSGAGILRIRGAEKEFVLRPPIALEEGVTGNAPFSVTVNGRGDLLWAAGTNRGDQRLVLTRDGKHISLAGNGVSGQPQTVVDGKVVTTWASQVIDEEGRVMATLRFTDNSFGLYVWENGVWKTAVIPEVTQHDGRPVITYGTIRAGADGFFVVLNLSGLGNTLARWKAGAWVTEIATIDPIVTGHVANSIGTFDVNRSGDVFAQCNTNSQVLVVKRAGKYHYIHALNELTADGDLIIRTTEYDIRDDGTVYFLGLTVNDEYVLYQAKPIR